MLVQLCAFHCCCSAQEAECGGRRTHQRLQEGAETGRSADLGPCGQGGRSPVLAASSRLSLKMKVTSLMFPFQQWKNHYCVISGDKLYYAEEEDEQEEDDIQKVKSAEILHIYTQQFLHNSSCN